MPFRSSAAGVYFGVSNIDRYDPTSRPDFVGTVDEARKRQHAICSSPPAGHFFL